MLQLTLASRGRAAAGSYVERLAGLDDLAMVDPLRRGHVAAPGRPTAELDLVRASLEAERIRELSA